MNRRKPGLPLSKAITGFVLYKTAGALSPNTLRGNHYLRSGGDVFTVQALLGRRTLEMAQHCARIALPDVAEIYRKASPADN